MAPDLAQHGFTAGASQAGPHARREGILEHAFIEPELQQHAVDALAQTAHQQRHAGGAGGLEQGPAAALASGLVHELEESPRRAALRGGVGDALGEHLMGVDVGAVRGDGSRAPEDLCQQVIGGGDQQAGVVETGEGSHGVLGRPATAGR